MDDFPDSMAWLAKPDGTLVIGHGPFGKSAVPPSRGTAFYVQDFALGDPEPWKIPARCERTTGAEFPAAPLPPVAWDRVDAGLFSEVFQEVIASVRSGIFEKTVPVVTETGTAAGGMPGQAIAAAMARQTQPLHSYGWVAGQAGFAGATPELLFTLQGTRLETMALAGTARSEDRDVFAADDKEIREHQFVVQALVAKLADLGAISAGSRKILDLGSIIHFLTTLGVELERPETPDRLIRRLHPTPALGPLPRTPETLAMLLNWRNRLGCPPGFGAPFGMWDEGEFQAIVAIRGIWWDDRKLLLPAGCGVIEASRLVNEWRELRLKREAVKKFLEPLSRDRVVP